MIRLDSSHRELAGLNSLDVDCGVGLYGACILRSMSFVIGFASGITKQSVAMRSLLLKIMRVCDLLENRVLRC